MAGYPTKRRSRIPTQIRFDCHSALDGGVFPAEPADLVEEFWHTRGGAFFFTFVLRRHIALVPALGEQLPYAIEIDRVARIEAIQGVPRPSLVNF